MLQLVLAQVHYQPDSWKDHAHTDYVQAEFAQMFQLKYVCCSALAGCIGECLGDITD